MALVVGIAGGSASGKTTLARAVAAYVGEDACLLLSHDRYYRSVPPGAPLPNFDHPSALDNDALVADLVRLRQGRSISAPRYDFASHQRSGSDSLDPRTLVLVDGILILAVPALRQALNVRVFVDVPQDVRLARRIRRDVVERGRDEADVIRQFITSVQPMHERWVDPSREHADLVVDGRRPTAELVREITSHLRSPL